MADQYRYVINTELKLKAGSLNTLLNDIKDIDKQIKGHFEKAGGGVRVPVTVDKDITKLQGEVKRVVEGYNKGQAPHIKVPVSIDESSIRQIQNRINALKNQLNSLSNEKKTVSLNTSLEVGKGEQAKIQRQVGETKASVVVGLRLNEQDIKTIKAQIESIKAEVKATVTANQDHSQGMRRFGSQRNDTPVANGGGRQGRQQNVAQAKRDYYDSYQYYQEKSKGIQAQIKGEQELGRLRTELERAKKSNTKTGDMYGYREDGSKFKVNANSYTKQLEEELKAQETLLRQLKRAQQATEIARQKMAQEPFMTPQAQKSVSKVTNKPSEQQRVQQQIAKADYQRQMREMEQQKREMERLQAHLGDMNKRDASYYDPTFDARQGIAKNNAVQNAKRLTEYQQQQAKAQAKADADKAKEDARKYQDRMARKAQRDAQANVPPTDNRSVDEKYYDKVAERRALESKLASIRSSVQGKDLGSLGNSNKRRILDNIAQTQNAIAKAIEEENKFAEQIFNLTGSHARYNNALRAGSSSNPLQNIQNTIRTNTDMNALRQAQERAQAQAQANNPFPDRVNNIDDAHRQANQVNNIRNRYAQQQQRADDYNRGIVRFGGNREYSAVDLEAQLRNPNVSLSDSLDILQNRIIPHNQQVAMNSQQNFQRAYTINHMDENGQVHSMRTLTYEFTRYGEAVERGDRSFKSLVSNMMRNIGVYTLFTGGFYMLSQSIGEAVRQMTDFDAKLASVSMIATNLNTGAIKDFYSQFGGQDSLKTNMTNQAFSTGEKYGVSSADTVMPIETQVMARRDLITGANGKADPNMQKAIVDKIIQFSAVSNGGNATSEEVNAISQDVLSLYQAMYSKGSTQHIGEMNNLLDYMAVMKANGVNTNAVTDAMSELAPDTIKKGLDTKAVAGMLGAYNLSDTDATGANLTQVAKTFFGSLAHAQTSPHVQSALKDVLGIDVASGKYDYKQLTSEVLKRYALLDNDSQKEAVANGLAGITGRSTAMTPKIVKFLDASVSGGYADQFNKDYKNTPNALEKSWNEFSGTLKRQFAELGEQTKQLVQTLAKLGVMDGIGALVKGFTLLLKTVNSVLGVVSKFSDLFGDHDLFNVPKFVAEIVALQMALKGIVGLTNKIQPAFALIAGNWLQGKVGSRLGFKGIQGVTTPVGGAMAEGGALLAQGAIIGATTGRTPRTILPTARPTGQHAQMLNALGDVMTYSAGDALAYRLAGGHTPTTPPVVPNAVRVAENAMPKRSVLRSVGGFFDDALMITAIRSGGIRRAGTAVAEKGAGAIAKIGEMFTKLVGPLRAFGILLTRLSVIGGALALGGWIVKSAYDANKKRMQERDDKETSNLKKQFKSNMKSTDTNKEFNANVDEWFNLNEKLLKGSPEAFGEGYNVYSSKEGKRFQELNDKFGKMGIRYYANGNRGFVRYKSQDEDGKWIEHKVSTDSTKGMAEFRKAMQGGGKNDLARIQEGWALNLDYLDDYNKKLIESNDLTKHITQSMKQLGYNLDSVDNKFMGATSMSSLNDKIQAIKSGLNDISADRAKLHETQSSVDTHTGMLNDDISKVTSKLLGKGISQNTINDIKDEYALEKQSGSTDKIMGKYDVSDKTMKDWQRSKKDGGLGLSEKEAQAKADQYAGLKELVVLIAELAGISDAGDQLKDSMLSVDQQYQQQELAMKQYTAQLLVMSSGVNVMDAKISQINSAVGMGRAMVQMADPNSREQISAQGRLIKASSELLKGYRAQLGSVSSKMSDIASQNPNQDFSIGYLYNPGEKGLTAEQQAYKDLLEKQTQIQDSVSSTTADVYDQAQQLKNMVLSSDKYADVWERVQQRTQLVKDANKEIFNMNNDLSMVNSMSLMRSAVTGQPVGDIKTGKLQEIRDRGLDTYEQLMTALNSYKGDSKKLKEAYAEINKTMGSEFDNAFIRPLKDLIKNDFDEAGNKILKGADSLNKVLGNWAKFAIESASNPESVAGQTQSFNDAMDIPSYNGKPAKDNRTFAEKEQAYLEQMGYKVGTAGYAQMKRQLEASYSHEDLVKEVNKYTVNTSNNKGVNDYSKDINKVLKGKLSGYGSVFTQYGAKYGVDPRLIASIAMQENGGDSNILRNSNNIGNIKAFGSTNDYWKGGEYRGYRSYKSLDAGIADLTRLIAKYFKDGKTSIPSINASYAEDPNWMNGVASFYSQQTGISKSSLLGGASIGSGGGSGGGGKSSYTGDSIVAYLNSIGESSSFSHRQTLAKKYGISGYTGTASQNTKLLGKLRADGGSSSSSSGGGSYDAMDSWFSSVKGDRSKMTYSWGGAHVIEDWTTFLKKGIADCSGLVEQVYRKFAGINLGTKSSQQLWNDNSIGKKVTNKKNLQKGDLVFFGNSSNSIHHVGIYAGNGEMWTINHKGTPVSKDKISSWGDYYGAKHIEGAFSKGSGSSKDEVSPETILKTALKAFNDSMKADSDLKRATYTQSKEALSKDIDIAYGQGNVRDVLGTSGRLAVYDRVTQQREDIYTQRYETVAQIKQLQTARKNYTKEYDKATKSGDKDTAKAYKDSIKSIDSLIKTLSETNKKLGDWDKKLSETQKQDPRLNYGKASSYIQGGYSKLRSMVASGDSASVDYYRVANEVNQMNSEYMTTAKKASIMGELWNASGQQTIQYSNIKRSNAQNELNLMFEKISKINGVLGKFVQGTQAWWTTLEDAVAVQKELNDLEQQRLQNAQDMFNLTGKGLQGYIKQRAYTQSHDNVQDRKNLASAINQYNKGTVDKGYGLKTGTYTKKEDAEKTQKYLKDTYGITAKVTKDKNGKYVVSTSNYLTKSESEKAQKGLKDKKYAKVTSTTGGGTTKMDANQELATLQIIAETQDKIISQMNDYRNAVVGAFKAGALSLEEYMKRMNDLRDLETEAKENTIKLVDSIQESFKDAFANALSSGMQGNIDAKQMFIDSMKQSMATAISTAISTALMSASGLTDIVNKFITGAVGAINSGDPDAIANMFNEDGSLKEDFNDALAPFLPLIDAIVKSTDGMFSIMKDQMFNAPQGFKIDSALYDVLKGMNGEGYRDWDGSGKNEAGSDTTSSGGNSGDASVPDSSTNPSGGNNGQSGGGATSTGSTENTTGSGKGKPDSDTDVTTPKTDKDKKPKPPSKKSKSKTYITTSDVWEHKSPDSKTSTRIKVIKKGTKVTVDDESHGFLHIGKGKWISAKYAKAYHSSSSGGSKGGSNDKGKGDNGKTKHIKSSVNFRSSAGYGNNVIGTLPKGASVQYLGTTNGWAHIEYKGKKGYVGPSYVYHTGGVAGTMNFSSPNGLKPDELSAILRKGETVFTDRQISSLVGASNTTNNGGDVNFNVTVNVEGSKDTGALQSAVEIAVKKAVKEIGRTTKFNNLSWKGTSY